jgi:outer membrane protein assembly factor BamD
MFDFKYIIIVLLSLGLSACSEFSRIQKSQDTKKKLEAAIAYHDQKEYYKSGVLLEEIVPLVKGTDQAELALFYLAENYYEQRQYMMSAYHYREYFLTYPKGPHHEESMFMHCKSLYMESPRVNLDQTSTYDALQAMHMFLNRYPRTPHLEECNRMADELNLKLEQKAYEMAKTFWKLRDYKAAVSDISNFIDDYPASEMLEEMHFLRMDSQYNLARLSKPGKPQDDRYYDFIGYYHIFVSKFPNSKYRETVDSYLAKAQESLGTTKAK